MLRALCIIAGLLFSQVATAQPMQAFPPGAFSNQAALAGSGYVGPGDVVSGAVALYSTRCGTTAYTGNVMEVWDGAAGNVTQTIVTCSAGGVLNQTVNPLSTTCAVSCRVKTLYDQTGGGQDLAQGINANRPTLTLNCLNTSLWCLTFDGTTSKMAATGSASHNSPWTVSSVTNCTVSGSQKPIWKDSGGYHGLQCIATTGTQECYAGTSLVTSASVTGAWHTMACVSATGAATTDGNSQYDLTANTGATNNQAFGTAWQLGTNNSGQFFKGTFTELLFYASGLTSGNLTTLHNNQCAYYGTTC